MTPNNLYSRSHLFMLALILALAGGLRLFSLTDLGFWFDELCTLSTAHGFSNQVEQIPVDQITPPLPHYTRLADAKPLWKIPVAMAFGDAHPPLYFIMLRLWEDLFGDSEAAVRSLSVALSLFAIALLYIAAADTTGPSTALTACLLMAVATPQILYSQEARNYMPVQVYAEGAFIAIGMLKRGKSPWAAVVLGLCMLAMMLTHYFAAGAAVGIALPALFYLPRSARNYLMYAIGTAALLFAVLWGPGMVLQHRVMQGGMGWLVDNAPGHLGRRIMDLSRLPVRFFAEVTDLGSQVYVALLGAVLLATVGALYVRRRELRPWIYWLAGGVGIVAVTDLARSMTELNWVRYSLFAAPPAYVLLAAAVRGPWRFVAPAAAVLLSLLCLRNAYVPAWKIDYRTTVQMINRLKGPEDALMIIGPDAGADGMAFSAFQRYSDHLPKITAVLTKPPTAETLIRLKQCRQVWIISLGKDRTLPGLQIAEEQTLPNMDIIRGRFD